MLAMLDALYWRDHEQHEQLASHALQTCADAPRRRLHRRSMLQRTQEKARRMETANMALSSRVSELEAAHAQLLAHKTSLTEQLRATTAQLTSALEVRPRLALLSRAWCSCQFWLPKITIPAKIMGDGQGQSLHRTTVKCGDAFGMRSLCRC